MNNQDALIRLECLKIANDICKSHNCPYGTDELEAELRKVLVVANPNVFHNEFEQGAFEQVIGKPRNNYPTNL